MKTAFDHALYAVCLLAAAVLYGEAMHRYGFRHGEAAKSCATVPGKQVISSTADNCTYADSYGRATTKRKAI